MPTNSKTHNEIVRTLNDAQTAVSQAETALRSATRKRHRAVVKAVELGYSRRQIGEILGLTGGRVQQIIDHPPPPVLRLKKRPAVEGPGRRVVRRRAP